MLSNIITTLTNSKTWFGAYASIYNLYISQSYQLAESIGNSFEYQAQLASKKDYKDDVYATIMEKSVTERARICIELNKAQGDLVRCRVNVCLDILSRLEHRVKLSKVKLHDYDLMMLLDSLVQSGESIELLSHYVGSENINDYLITSGDSSEILKIIIDVMENTRELPDLPNSIGNFTSTDNETPRRLSKSS